MDSLCVFEILLSGVERGRKRISYVTARDIRTICRYAKNYRPFWNTDSFQEIFFVTNRYWNCYRRSSLKHYTLQSLIPYLLWVYSFTVSMGDESN